MKINESIYFIKKWFFLITMKCEICKKNIEENFLKKPFGTYVKDKNGKRHLICTSCQTKLDNDKEKIIAAL